MRFFTQKLYQRFSHEKWDKALRDYRLYSKKSEPLFSPSLKELMAVLKRHQGFHDVEIESVIYDRRARGVILAIPDRGLSIQLLKVTKYEIRRWDDETELTWLYFELGAVSKGVFELGILCEFAELTFHFGEVKILGKGLK